MMLVDDHPLWRQVLRKVLEQRGAGTVVAEASDGTEALEAARRRVPDLVVMDMELPEMDGVEATRRLRSEHPGIRVLVVSSFDERSDVVDALRAGAAGYLLKTAGGREVADAVRKVHAGELVLPPHLAQVVLKELHAPSAEDAERPVASGPGARGRAARRTTEAESGTEEIGNVFAREGDFWTLAYEGDVVRVADSKGLRDVAELLRAPGKEIHALDLMLAREGGAAIRKPIAEPGLVAPGDAGPVLDSQARAAYTARLKELQDEIDEAESWADPERGHRARTEMDFLARELARAVGLGGRERRAGSAAEKARINVTRTIRSAIAKIRRLHPSLAEHLSRSVKTGSFCRYDPENQTHWTL